MAAVAAITEVRANWRAGFAAPNAHASALRRWANWQAAPQETSRALVASHESSPLVETASGSVGDAIHEDCLALNVFTPRAKRAARLPVMVRLHGGVPFFGAGGLPLQGARPWPARGRLRWRPEQREAVRADGSWQAAGGMRQTAGAQSVQALMSLLLSRQWMHRSIVQSADGFAGQPRANARQTGARVASRFHRRRPGGTSHASRASRTSRASGSFSGQQASQHSSADLRPDLHHAFAVEDCAGLKV